MRTAQRVPLGGTGLTLTRLGLGTAPIGGLFAAVEERTAEQTVLRAYQLGVRWYDTAPLYGHGSAERRLGHALRSQPREDYVLATKVGRLLRPHGERDRHYHDAGGLAPVFDFSGDGVRRSLEDSLQRLGLDRVDVVHIHDPDDHHDEALAGAVPALAQLRAEGVIGAMSVGMNQTSMLARFAREADFDCFLLAGRYTLLDQSALDELLPACVERGIAVLAGGVFNSGILAAPDDNPTYDYDVAQQPVRDRARRIAAVCRRHDVAPTAAAMQFPLGHPAVVSVVVGARSATEVADNVAAFGTQVPAELWGELRAEGLLRTDAPTPETTT